MLLSVLRHIYNATMLCKEYQNVKRLMDSELLSNHEKKNKGKKIYLIKRDAKVGLCSYIIVAVGQIYTAKRCGYVPVVDMKNYINTYLEDDLLGKENVWEYYFEQPGDITLDEAYKSKNMIFSNDDFCIRRPSDCINFLKNNNCELTSWRRFFKNNVRIKKDVNNYILGEYKRIILGDDKVLGVLCRGTDYIIKRPKDHPVQPTPQEVIEKAREVIEQKGCTKLFLATEDISIMNIFVKEFGEMVVTNEHKLWEHNVCDYLANEMECNGESKRSIGLNYLTTIAILSKCNCLIGGVTSGLVVALLMSEGYEYSYFWDLGRY